MYQLSIHNTPNRSKRIGHPIYFVMHRMEGHFDYTVNEEFPSAKAQASADECVSRDGKRVAVFNFASSGLKTWEVGNANSLCMGWEIEGFDGDEASLPDELFDTLAARLVKAQAAVKKHYGVTIPLTHSTKKGQPGIVSHYQITQFAYGGTDHSDAKNFPWPRLMAAIKRAQGAEPREATDGAATHALEVIADGHIVKHLTYGGGRVNAYIKGRDFARLVGRTSVRLLRHAIEHK